MTKTVPKKSSDCQQISFWPIVERIQEVVETPHCNAIAWPVVENTVTTQTKEETKGLRYNKDKIPLDLISEEFENQLAKVLAFGKIKYSAHNWRKGLPWSETLASAKRHISSFNDPAKSDYDEETGIHHLAHAACNLMFLLEFVQTHPELDDRYKL